MKLIVMSWRMVHAEGGVVVGNRRAIELDRQFAAGNLSLADFQSRIAKLQPRVARLHRVFEAEWARLGGSVPTRLPQAR